MLQWYEDHGRNARLTGRQCGVSPDTVSRWLRRYQQGGVRALEDRSRRPRRVRCPTWSRELALAVLQLREAHPRWGKAKLVVRLRQQGFTCSTAMVGRILRRLKDAGVRWAADRRDPWLPRPPQARPYAVRKPKDYRPLAPGDLVPVDTADLRLLPGVTDKHVTARDVVCR
jgi:transposase